MTKGEVADADPDAATEGFRRVDDDAGGGEDGRENRNYDDRDGPTSASVASEAFAGLGNETRLRIARAVVDSEEPPTLTDLFGSRLRLI
jgi:hypothetical protein